jgi:ADP-ribosylglycohydrolase
MLLNDRGRGALLGLAVGDAFGTTLEFSSPAPAPFEPPLTGPHVEITGGGPFLVARGQTTDDTMMAVCLWRSLQSCGRFSAKDVAARYVAWSAVTFDIGAQTAASLRRVAKGHSPMVAGRDVWLESNRRPAGNGSLMRTAPIGVFFAHDHVARVQATVMDSQITHADPRCVLSCAALNGAIAAAVRGSSSTPEHAFAAARADVEAASALLPGDPEDSTAREAIEADLRAAQSGDPALYGEEVHLLRMEGFVRVAFRLAFFELGRARSFQMGLVDAVNRGGDADTNGAITGALLGAQQGASAIPASLSEPVLAALMSGPAGPLRDEYHPRFLMEP